MKKIDNENNETNEYIIPARYMPIPFLDGLEEIKNSLKFRTEKGDVKYGIEILDAACGFIPPGTITLIAAVPNVGKSLCAQLIATNIAKQGKKVLIASCEMSAGQLMSREMVKEANITNKGLLEVYKKDPNMANRILDKFEEDESYDYLKNIKIMDICGIHVDELIKIFDVFDDYRYIIVDYVQRISGTGDSEYKQLCDVSYKLHTYAMRTRKSIIECSQIPKTNENEARTQKNGINFQLLRAKGAGNFEEDADIVIKMAEELEGNTPYVLINLFKNRCGGTKAITYKYEKIRLNLVLKSKGV